MIHSSEMSPRRATTPLVILLLLVCHTALYGNNLYGKRSRLWAVTLTQSQLAEIFLKTQDYIKTANANRGKASSQTLELSDGVVTERREGELSADVLRFRLPVAYRVRFTYTAGGGAIGSVVIDLADSSRDLEVEGVDTAQVDALFALLNEEFGRYVHWFGGTGFTFLIILIFGVLPSAVFVVGRANSYVMIIAASLIGLGGVMTLIAQPFGPIFPGCAVWATDATLWGRHSSLIGLIGTIAGTVALVPIAKSVTGWLRSRRKAPTKRV